MQLYTGTPDGEAEGDLCPSSKWEHFKLRGDQGRRTGSRTKNKTGWSGGSLEFDFEQTADFPSMAGRGDLTAGYVANLSCPTSVVEASGSRGPSPSPSFPVRWSGSGFFAAHSGTPGDAIDCTADRLAGKLPVRRAYEHRQPPALRPPRHGSRLTRS